MEVKGLVKRRALLWVPVVVVPLLGLLFYSMGGGRNVPAGTVLVKGLNMALPLPKLDSSGKKMDKMDFYHKADRDSLKRLDLSKLDPYAKSNGRPDSVLGRDSAHVGLRP